MKESKARALPWTRQGEPPWTGTHKASLRRGFQRRAFGGVQGQSPWPSS